MKGPVHSVKELEVSTRLTLSSTKDYLVGDNSDIIATDSQKNTVYVLAKKYGVKSPEEFAALLCKHFLSTYSHVMKAVVVVEEIMWNRISYGDHANSQKLHNHAFIHTPLCTRSATVTLERGGEFKNVKHRRLHNTKMLKNSYLKINFQLLSLESKACACSKQRRAHLSTLLMMLTALFQMQMIESSGSMGF